MFETFVSSRVRRTLLEYVLTHPAGQFYLRGLAKDLGLSVSPLRRELKRLESSGMLKAMHEGNMVFYAVSTTSPAFLQLRQAGLGTQEFAQGSRLKAQGNGSGLQPSAFSLQPIQVGVISATSTRSWWRAPLSSPLLIGAAAVGMALVLMVAGLAYLTLAHQQMAASPSRTVATRDTKVTVVVPSASASGTMRGARWHIVPGGFGGFSSASNDGETY